MPQAGQGKPQDQAAFHPQTTTQARTGDGQQPDRPDGPSTCRIASRHAGLRDQGKEVKRRTVQPHLQKLAARTVTTHLNPKAQSGQARLKHQRQRRRTDGSESRAEHMLKRGGQAQQAPGLEPTGKKGTVEKQATTHQRMGQHHLPPEQEKGKHPPK